MKLLILFLVMGLSLSGWAQTKAKGSTEAKALDCETNGCQKPVSNNMLSEKDASVICANNGNDIPGLKDVSADALKEFIDKRCKPKIGDSGGSKSEKGSK